MELAEKMVNVVVKCRNSYGKIMTQKKEEGELGRFLQKTKDNCLLLVSFVFKKRNN